MYFFYKSIFYFFLSKTEKNNQIFCFKQKMTSSDGYAPYVSDMGGVLKTSSSDGMIKYDNDSSSDKKYFSDIGYYSDQDNVFENDGFEDEFFAIGLNTPDDGNYHIEYNYLMRFIYPFNSCNINEYSRNLYNRIYHLIFLVLVIIVCSFLLKIKKKI